MIGYFVKQVHKFSSPQLKTAMASLSNLSISYTPASPVANGPVEVRVNYTVQFSPMEKLLASYGLRFGVRIHFYDVDFGITEDDEVQTANMFISAAQIAGTPANNRLHLEFTRVYDRPELRGPDDDGSEFQETLRAQVCLLPIPGKNADAVTGACALTNYVPIDTQGPTIFPG
jgi:hypothetical protein